MIKLSVTDFSIKNKLQKRLLDTLDAVIILTEEINLFTVIMYSIGLIHLIVLNTISRFNLGMFSWAFMVVS